MKAKSSFKKLQGKAKSDARSMLLNKNEVDYRYTMSEIVGKFPFVKEQQQIRKKIFN